MKNQKRKIYQPLDKYVLRIPKGIDPTVLDWINKLYSINEEVFSLITKVVKGDLISKTELEAERSKNQMLSDLLNRMLPGNNSIVTGVDKQERPSDQVQKSIPTERDKTDLTIIKESAESEGISPANKETIKVPVEKILRENHPQIDNNKEVNNASMVTKEKIDTNDLNKGYSRGFKTRRLSATDDDDGNEESPFLLNSKK